MYAKRIQIVNYGPIDDLDIQFPFNGKNPKPILLVGENGSGKSILLSHIVNYLLVSQGTIYTQNSEVEQGRVYKIRSSSYIKSENKFYYSRAEFENGLFWQEVVLYRSKEIFEQKPNIIPDGLWGKLGNKENSSTDGGIDFNKQNGAREFFDSNAILYFPPNRFEEPAWLNEENLKAKAEYIRMKHMVEYTDRKIINYSPLRDNQNWLFEVLYDKYVFEIQSQTLPVNLPNQDGNTQSVNLPLFLDYEGVATQIYENVLAIVRKIFGAEGTLRFGIGRRRNRTISLIRDEKNLVPNIFQLSTGETALLNIFLSILRDYDLSKASFNGMQEIRGIVIVDEMDLHLHSIHQHEVLPELIKMFPRVQFIVTTHSPLFVLGMEKTLGEDGFALYRLPQGNQISPEEFSEFGSAYQSFMETQRFSEDLKRAIKESQKPMLFVEGKTDVIYLKKAAELLGKNELINKFEIKDVEGSPNLKNMYNKFDPKLAEIIPQETILLHDCDVQRSPANKSKLYQRTIPKQKSHPLEKGIENLFTKKTLEKAKKYKAAFIDITDEHTRIERGTQKTIHEKWTVNEDEKMNLCNWLCETGTREDFAHFQTIFDLLEKVLAEKTNQGSS